MLHPVLREKESYVSADWLEMGPQAKQYARENDSICFELGPVAEDNTLLREVINLNALLDLDFPAAYESCATYVKDFGSKPK